MRSPLTPLCILLALLFGCAQDDPDPGMPPVDPSPDVNPEASPLIGETGVTMAQYATAFVWISACQGDEMQEVIQHISERLSDRGARAERFKTRIDCINAADDCAAANQCAGLTQMPCDEDNDVFACEGNTAVSCDYDMLGGRIRRTDCGADLDGNTECVDDGGISYCASPAQCEGFDTRCEGDRLIECADGVAQARDCTLTNRVCAVDDGGRARCVAPPVDCQPCDGTVAQLCDAGVVQNRFDCGLFGLQCDAEAQDRLPCIPVDPVECEDFAYQCAGDIAQICVAGQWVEWDCGAIGAECVQNDFHIVCRLPE